MKITLIPSLSFVGTDEPPFVGGDTLTYRGRQYDLSPLGEGEEIEIGLPFIGSVTRQNGELLLTLEYRYSTETAKPNQPADWSAYTFNVTNGQCPCPIIRKPLSEVPE